MREHFPLIMTVLFLAGIGIFAAARLRKVKERRKGLPHEQGLIRFP